MNIHIYISIQRTGLDRHTRCFPLSLAFPHVSPEIIPICKYTTTSLHKLLIFEGFKQAIPVAHFQNWQRRSHGGGCEFLISIVCVTRDSKQILI